MTLVPVPDHAAAYQASVVALDGRALLIEGEPASGKTSLALALIDRGGVLVGDDGVMLADVGGVLWAFPHPATRGMVEIRNVGIVTMQAAPAPVALAVTLAHGAPRHVEGAGSRTICGLAIPSLALWPDTPVLWLRAKWAMKVHGLPILPAVRDSGPQ
jgi:serine kinase of HPr protein (carbohydrate metabolism regulator)